MTSNTTSDDVITRQVTQHDVTMHQYTSHFTTVYTDADTANGSTLGMTESEDEFLRRKDLELVQALIPTITILCFLMSAGVVGNTVVFLVYYRRFQASVTRVYILAMAVCDFLTNVLAIPLQLLEIRFNATFYVTAACKAIRSGSSVPIVFSAFILVAVAVHRKRMVYGSAPGPQDTVKGAYRAVVLCALAALLLAVPYAVLVGDHARTFPDSNVTGVTCTFADKYAGTAFPIAYNAVTIAAYLTCAVIVGVSYAQIARHLWQHKREARSLSLQSASQSAPDVYTAAGVGSVKAIPTRTTSMMFVLAVVFAINYLPYFVVAVIDEVAPEVSMEELEVNVRYLCKRSFYINSAVNPVVYGFVSCRFRHECRALFNSCLRRA